MILIDLFGNPIAPLGEEPKTPTLLEECKCWHCSGDLCAELDSYYGKDDLLGKLCVKCRTKVLKDEQGRK